MRTMSRDQLFPKANGKVAGKSWASTASVHIYPSAMAAVSFIERIRGFACHPLHPFHTFVSKDCSFSTGLVPSESSAAAAASCFRTDDAASRMAALATPI